MNQDCEQKVTEGAMAKACISGQGLTLSAEVQLPLAKVRRITIEELDRGYVVAVGCQNLVVEDTEVLITKLADYLRNPSVIEKKYLSGVKEFFK